MRMTPNDIDVLLHYYTTFVEHERVNAPAVGETVSGFLERGILREATLDEKGGTPAPGYRRSSYRVTEKGNKLVQMLCVTPDPEQKWLDPRCEDPARHEEEMRWIARAKAAEARVRELEDSGGSLKTKVAMWAIGVGVLLKKLIVSPGHAVNCAPEASRLFSDAIALGIIPEQDCGPGEILPPKKPAVTRYVGEWVCRCDDFPGQVIRLCPKCGGRKV